jgi:HlyD family secretion protein
MWRNNMLHKKTWIILSVLIIIILGGGYFYYSATAEAEAANEPQEIQTALVRQGDITVSATGAGTVIPATEVALSFQTGGILEELLVTVGEEVQSGDILARLNDDDAQQAITDAELQLAPAVIQTDGSSTGTGLSYNDIGIEQAQITLDNVQTDLNELLNWTVDEDEIAQAEANLATAQTGYNAALGQESALYSGSQVAAINLEAAQRELAEAETAYTTAFDPGREWELYSDRHQDALIAEREIATNRLQNAKDSLAIAEANYSASVTSTNNSGSTSAQSSILSAELALQAAQEGPTAEEVADAETTLRQAELTLQQALLDQETDSINLQHAQFNLLSAEQGLLDTLLVAPMDGTIMSIDGNEGEQVSTSTFMTLADLEQPMLEIYLDETDLDTVGVGYEVQVVFDALPDDLFTGHVTQVDPQLSVVGDVTAVRAIVQLDADSFAKPQTLPVGMNATVDVIGGQTEGALLVPVESVRELSPGQYAVFVMENGEPQMRMVEVGLMDYTYAEILSGLELGETVTTGIVETRQQQKAANNQR